MTETDIVGLAEIRQVDAELTSGALGHVPPLVDVSCLPAGDAGQEVINAAHRWYEHLIALWAPGVLEAAHDLGVFTALAAGPRTADQLAAELGSDPRATRVLLEGLYAYDVVERTWDPGDWSPAYSLPRASAECLLPGGLYSLAGKMDYDRRMAWDAWRNLARQVRDGSRDATGAERLNQISEAEYESLVRGINFWAPPIVDVLARALRERGWTPARPARMLDVGCGTGLYGQLLLRRFPGLSAVGVDVARILKLAETQAAELGVADRFTPRVLDFQTDSWGEGYDLVFFANIFHLQTAESARELAAKAAAAVAEGGVVAIADHILDDEPGPQSTQNRFFRLFAVSMLATGGGGAYTVDDYDGWLAAAGLRRVALLDTPMHRVLLAVRD